jgi:hypothetical protein
MLVYAGYGTLPETMVGLQATTVVKTRKRRFEVLSKEEKCLLECFSHIERR